MAKRYDHAAIEEKWQRYWGEQQTFRTIDPGDPAFDGSKPKFYVLDMFPYPSGAGLHVGHPLGYIATDIIARYKRMAGHNVLHPMGFDAFGLPAEQYAVEHGIHPRVTTERNVSNMRRQLKALGLSYDWNREVSTTEPDYYRWTQWIFLQLFNSYFDPTKQRARPIAELIAQLETGQLHVDETLNVNWTDSARAVQTSNSSRWQRFKDLDAGQRRQVLDNQRLAYIANVPVNWCPALGTVLANEEVTNEGRSERGDHPVFKRPLRQWMLRITAYAERLLAELEQVDWPEPIKLMQRNWIGRSEGAAVNFPLASGDEKIEVFTTRPDTLFGATYVVLAPEHPLVDQITAGERRAQVQTYKRRAANKSEIDRQAETKDKTGVFTGAYAINPVNNQRIPIWIADYVLMGYGTGAIMAVPGHDQRDFAFAIAFELPIVAVVMPPDAWIAERCPTVDNPDSGPHSALYRSKPGAFGLAYSGDGVAVNSANEEISLDGKPTAQAKLAITEWLEANGRGRRRVQYKLRDWLFSRQRYWGEPFPVLHDAEGVIVAVNEADLPVELPQMDDFSPTTSNDPEVPPQPSLSRAEESWRVVDSGGKRYLRELNTMPQWAGSCWYYLRFTDPKNTQQFAAPEKERYWMGGSGVDLYVGGAEHAVLHLLYARFWHKVLYDLGRVSTVEPFGHLFNQGYILAPAYRDERETYVPADEVEERDGGHLYRGKPVERSYGKMGKSLKNVVTPDEICSSYGCDTLRVYEMYLGPLEVSKPWNTRDIVGASRFLQRVWRNFYGDAQAEPGWTVVDQPADADVKRLLHKTIKRVTEDMERLRFNTALAALMELNNALVARETLPREVAEPLVLMLSPFAPHIAEELWQALEHEQSLAYQPWPGYDASLLTESQVEIVIQIMGKTRGRISVSADAEEAQIKDAALREASVAKHLAGKAVRKVIYVPGRLVNIVAS